MDKRVNGHKSKITVKHHTDPPSWRFQKYKFRGKSGTGILIPRRRAPEKRENPCILGDPGAVSRVGRKGGTKVFITDERAPGYRLSPDHFQKFKRMPAPDWAQKMLCIIVPNRRTNLNEFISFVRTWRLLSRSRLVWLHSLSIRPSLFLFRFHFSPFPQKRLILRLLTAQKKCT